MNRLGIYVQVPFCQTKCTYCNFHTGVVATSRFAPYAEAVCTEIRGHRELLKAVGVDWPGRDARSDSAPQQREKKVAGEVGERPASEGEPYTDESWCVDTVYMGGGTPSLLDPGHLQKILDTIRETLDAGGEREVGGVQKSGGEPSHSQEVTLEADPE